MSLREVKTCETLHINKFDDLLTDIDPIDGQILKLIIG